MPLPSTGNGKLVAEFQKDDVTSWLDGLGQAMPSLIDTILIVLMVVGFATFMFGIVRYMREARARAASLGGSEPSYAIWLIFAGGGLGSLSTVTILLIRFIKL